MVNTCMKRILLLSLAAAFAVPSQAAFFNWENLALGNFNSVSQTDAGITATATSNASGGLIESADHMGTGLAAFQTRAIIARQSSGFAPIRIDFSATMTSVSIQVGDNGADDEGTITVFAYTAANALVDSDSFNYGLLNTPVTLSVAGSGIAYIIGNGGGTSPGSLYWDNITANPVPEPATMAILGLAAAAMLRRRRN